MGKHAKPFTDHLEQALSPEADRARASTLQTSRIAPLTPCCVLSRAYPAGLASIVAPHRRSGGLSHGAPAPRTIARTLSKVNVDSASESTLLGHRDVTKTATYTQPDAGDPVEAAKRLG